ncbi:TrbC/VirB2 family protein [Kiloniella laminariae]|uniref:TrbC/VirB2 family protein n=1 Tax=Kiloniella laminariae TaxID=454162 RepID=UPI00035E7BA7|nr:TrbC/VirB2 family protein [Kiloniella laminariae]
MKSLKNLILTFSVLAPFNAMAAGNGEWIKPATGLLENLESGLVTFGVPVVGIAVLLVGIGGALFLNLDPKKMGVVIGAGALITVGPAAIKGLLALAQ